MGPLGFQPDVFENPPGTDRYRPLQRIIFVSWVDESTARELKSLADVMDAKGKGELALEGQKLCQFLCFLCNSYKQ